MIITDNKVKTTVSIQAHLQL